MKTVEITIDPDGGVTIEATGFKGGSCERATKALEEAMGVAGKRDKKPSYYQQEVSPQKVGK